MSYSRYGQDWKLLQRGNGIIKTAIDRENKIQHHPDSVLALLQTTNTASLTQEQTMRLLLIASEMMYRMENE